MKPLQQYNKIKESSLLETKSRMKLRVTDSLCSEAKLMSNKNLSGKTTVMSKKIGKIQT
jgi:hypothetical protein